MPVVFEMIIYSAVETHGRASLRLLPQLPRFLKKIRFFGKPARNVTHKICDGLSGDFFGAILTLDAHSC